MGQRSIPDSHRDLLDEPVHAVFTTMMASGQPQSSIVWCDFDGECIRVNTTLERQKGRNIQANPKVTLLLIDKHDANRWMEVRGDAEITTEGAHAHLDKLTTEYTANDHFYGAVAPLEQAQQETRIILRIKAKKVNLDAVHK